MNKYILLIMISLCFSQYASNYGSYGVRLHPSPYNKSMGDAGAGLPSRDIYAAYYNPASFVYVSDATDNLVECAFSGEQDEIENCHYQSGLGDIDIVDHVIKHQEINEKSVLLQHGYGLTLFNFFTISKGEYFYTPNDWLRYETEGYMYNLKGLLDILYYSTGNTIINKLSKRFNVQHITANINPNHNLTSDLIGDKTDYKSTTISLNFSYK